MPKTKVHPTADKARLRLRATIEANRLARLSREVQDEKLTKFKLDMKKAKGDRKEWLNILITIITERQEQIELAEANRTIADYNDGCINGGGGSGTDSG